MQQPNEQVRERLLIICADRDNDVGRKAGVKTPIVGRKGNMEAAVKLILVDPEEADANTMFEAIRIYDNLIKTEESSSLYEVATIAGSELGGITADKKLVAELTEVLKRFPTDGLILVTDGFADEDVIPLVQSRVPVTSVRRVVVKHSESIEETAAVFSRYLKMLIEDPRYSKIALGLPGILLISLGALWFLREFIPYDIGTWAWIVGLIIVGSYLLGRGYGLDRKLLAFSRWLSHAYLYSLPGRIRGFSLVTGILLMGVGSYQAWSFIAANIIPFPLPMDLGAWLELIPRIIGEFIKVSLTMIVIGVCIIFLGRTLGHFFERDSRFWRTLTLTVICAWSWEIFKEISSILIDFTLPPNRLIAAIVIGIMVIIASSLSTHLLGKKYQRLFKTRVKEGEEPS